VGEVPIEIEMTGASHKTNAQLPDKTEQRGRTSVEGDKGWAVAFRSVVPNALRKIDHPPTVVEF
jgi:hypothetical protein